MRRILIIGFFAFLGFFQVNGKPVTKQEVRTVVNAFITSVFPSGNTFQIAEITPVYRDGDTTAYIVNLKPEGWVLLSGDDRATPVLGYSESGSFDPAYPDQNSVGYWMNYYVNSLVSVKNDRHLSRNTLWNGNAGNFSLKSTATTSVQPMIPVKWDQGKSWNIYCPSDANGPDGHVYVGCVGVCMAQAMSYYHYPSQGAGSKTYYQSPYGTIIVHYDLESPYQWDSMALSTADKFNTRLLYHCAVSVQMDFGADGSSAQTKNIPSALNKYFKYYSGARYLDRYADDSTWTSLLISELVAGRPVIYSGFPPDNSVGHAFDIDGVDSRGYFHLNWGWNGKYNGYYMINNLRPGSQNFTTGQGAVINIRPPVYRPTDLDLTKKFVKEGMPAGTYVGLLKITDEAKDNEYVVRVKVDSASGDSNLSPDFYISHDSLKTSTVFLYNAINQYTLYIQVEDKFGHTYQEKFVISILQNGTPTSVAGFTEQGIEVYPNPSSGTVNIKNPLPGRYTVNVTDEWGKLIRHFESDGPQSVIELSHEFPGIYFFRITPEKGTPVTRKLIIR